MPLIRVYSSLEARGKGLSLFWKVMVAAMRSVFLGQGSACGPSPSPPPSLWARGTDLDLKMEKVPGLPRSLVLCLFKLAPRKVSVLWPPALILLGEVFTGVYFLLKMSLLGMNVDWFVLKLVNCIRKTCGQSMRQPPWGLPIPGGSQ